jgi:transcriptional regulator
MYLPKHFEVTDVAMLHRLVAEHPLGTLVTMTPRGLDANHIPFLVQPDPAPYGTLHGHVARANPLWRDADTNVEALIIFHGPEAYVSPSWYPTKRDTAEVVPTWNYVVVHAHGRLRFIDDAAWVRAHVEALTNDHERSRQEPWNVTDAPADFVARLVGALIGLELEINRLVGKWKVSQNRSPRDRAGVIEGLLREGSEASANMAESIRRIQAKDD